MGAADDYYSQASQFQSSVPELQKSLQQNAAGQARRQLAGTLTNVKENANSRGLLYSGLKTGAEDSAKATSAGNLAQTYYNINQGVNDAGNQVQSDALQRLLAGYQGDVNAAEQQYGLNLQRQGQQQGLIGNLAGAGIGAGAILLASDERLKDNISEDDDSIREILDNIGHDTYEYKDEKFGTGKHLSPMAQDLEKSEIGKSMVIDTPEGKMVNVGKGMGAVMAVQSYLNKRLDKLEARKEAR